jgi:hypothetical protein
VAVLVCPQVQPLRTPPRRRVQPGVGDAAAAEAVEVAVVQVGPLQTCMFMEVGSNVRSC